MYQKLVHCEHRMLFCKSTGSFLLLKISNCAESLLQKDPRTAKFFGRTRPYVDQSLKNKCCRF